MEKKKKILSDSIWSIVGLVLMNVSLQFAVYPFWERISGEAALGNILYLISLMNVFAVSMGVSVNYARLKKSADSETKNLPYLSILGASTAVCVILALLISFFGGVQMSVAERVIFVLVMCATMWRYYADVEYKMSLNYKRYFLYYLFISIGYGVGIALFAVTGLWPLTLLVGEAFGLAFVLFTGKIFKADEPMERGELGDALKLVMILLGSEMLSTLIFNADKILLKTVIDEIAVTDFYLASLLGKTIALLTAPLTGVIIGYLSKYKGEFTPRIMNISVVVAALMVVLATAACTIGSYILIPILYPNQFVDVKEYFITANLSQVVFFVGSVMTVVLLRFAKSKYQMYITAIYAAAFAAVCIPFAMKWGLSGFCIGLVITCLARFLITVFLGYFSAIKNIRNKKHCEE